MSNKRKRRYVLAALLAVIVATAGFAFAAANTVTASNAGIGSGTVSGYNVTAVSWDLNDANPALIDDVTFTLNVAAAEVRARATGTGGASLGTGWVACAGAGTYTCTLSGVNTLDVLGLEVASAS